MAIKIVEDGPDITIKSSEYARLQREWENANRYTTMPLTFEEFVRSRQKKHVVDASNCWCS